MLSSRFSSSSRTVIARARTLAREHRHDAVGTAHLLLAVLEEPRFGNDEELELDRVCSLLLSSGVSRAEARLYAESALTADEGEAPRADFYSPALERVLSWARTHTYAEIIEPEHLFIALIRPQNGPHVGDVVRPLGLEQPQLDAFLRGLERDGAHNARPLRMLDKRSRATLKRAREAMRTNYCGRVSTSHLLVGLLETRAPIRVFLQKQGVNLDELRAVAAKVRSNDGEIGGPQIQLAPITKRAIERAKTLAIKSQLNEPQPRIAPEHLWLALLPRAASAREKLRWGGELTDPLAEVWKRFDSEPLKNALQLYLINSALGVSSPSQTRKSALSSAERVNKVHLDWLWVMAGIVCHLAWLFGLETGGILLALATFFGLIVAISGAAIHSRPLRDGAASWLFGLMAGIFVTWCIGAALHIS